MRTSSQIDSAADVINAVRSGYDVVLVCLEDVAMDAALHYTSVGYALPVEFELGVGSECLQIDPVGARVRHCQRALPCDFSVGLERISALNGEVKS